MHNLAAASKTKRGVMMMKKKEENAVQGLRDVPVPPVKGAVTDQPDVLPRPAEQLGKTNAVNLDDTIIFDGWL